MAKLVIGLLAMFVVVGTADINAEMSILWIGLGLLVSCAIFLVGAHELLRLNTVTYDRK